MNFLIFILINTLRLISLYLFLAVGSYILNIFSIRKARAYQIKQKYSEAPYNNNLVVLVYAQNNEKTVVPLLEALNKQTYPKNNYQVHIILDNCTDNSSNILEFIGGAKIWRVGEGYTMGKDEAISWTLERLLSFQNANAFVFLNANRLINENFLNSINVALINDDVITGATNIIIKEKSLKTNIIDAYNKYRNNVIKFGRTLRGLSNIIDSDVAVIKQEVIEKIKCVDFKDTDSELKYTTLLAKNNYICKFNPNIVTAVDIKDFQIKEPSLKFKLSLFSSCLKVLFPFNYKFTEHVFNMLSPSALLFIILYALVTTFTYNFTNLFDYSYAFAFGVITVISFIASAFICRFTPKESLYILANPAKRILDIILNSNFVSNFLLRGRCKKVFSNVEKMTVDVEVTSGHASFDCKLDLLSEDGLARAVFRFKKKKYSSSSHIRMNDAIREIVEKLEEHGFRLKICQVCGYFSQKIDGSINLVKGICHKCVSEQEQTEEKETLLWTTCKDYIPKEINKVIDISTYM